MFSVETTTKKRQRINRLVLCFLWLPHWWGPCAKRNNADSNSNDSSASKDEGYSTMSSDVLVDCSSSSSSSSSLPAACHRPLYDVAEAADRLPESIRRWPVHCRWTNERRCSVHYLCQPSGVRNPIAPFSCKRRIPAPNWKNWKKRRRTTPIDANEETPSSAHYFASPSFNSNKRGPIFLPSVTLFPLNSNFFYIWKRWLAPQATQTEPDTTQLGIIRFSQMIKI